MILFLDKFVNTSIFRLVSHGSVHRHLKAVVRVKWFSFGGPSFLCLPADWGNVTSTDLCSTAHMLLGPSAPSGPCLGVNQNHVYQTAGNATTGGVSHFFDVRSLKTKRF